MDEMSKNDQKLGYLYNGKGHSRIKTILEIQ